MHASPAVYSVVLLSLLLAMPCHAQQASPVAVRALDSTPAARTTRTGTGTPSMLQPDARRSVNKVSTLLGGALGGVAGTMIGMEIASQTSKGCHGELCGLGDYLLGITLGETIGLAVGAHLGSGSAHSERIVLTSLSSLGILVGGAFAGAGLAQIGAGAIMLPLTPMLQLATALAIESH